ncbi:hypothetical protein YC2023_112281 [Brassica napus]
MGNGPIGNSPSPTSRKYHSKMGHFYRLHRHRRWIMHGCNVISLYMTIARSVRDSLSFLESVPLALGLKIILCFQSKY